MFKLIKTLFIVLTFLGLLIVACTKNAASNFISDCSGTPKAFATDVNPIIQATCVTNSGCHAAGSSRGPGALTTYQQIYNSRAAIRQVVASGSMPENGSLSVAQKNAIICWIDNGATNN